MSPIQAVLAKLPDAKRTPQGWRAKCPGHKDTNPSLDVAEGDDGRVLLTCRAGCDSARVVDGMGLGLKNLFPPREPRRQQPTIYQIKDAQGQGCRACPRRLPRHREERSGAQEAVLET